MVQLGKLGFVGLLSVFECRDVRRGLAIGLIEIGDAPIERGDLVLRLAPLAVPVFELLLSLFKLILESENFVLKISFDLGEGRLALLFCLRTGGQCGAQLVKFRFEA